MAFYSSVSTGLHMRKFYHLSQILTQHTGTIYVQVYRQILYYRAGRMEAWDFCVKKRMAWSISQLIQTLTAYL